VSGKRSRDAREAGIALERSRDGASGTFLLGQGKELRTVMELLGHSTIWLTADTYGKSRVLHQAGEKPQVSRLW